MKNRSINRTIAEVESFDCTEPRELVRRGIAAGWIIPPAPAPKIEPRVVKRKKKSRHC